MEITRDKSYRLLLRSGRNYNPRIKATENHGVGGVTPPKARKKLEAELKGGRACLRDAGFVARSTGSGLALGPWKAPGEATAGRQDRHD